MPDVVETPLVGLHPALPLEHEVDPHGTERWCTTSQLQELLRRDGLDIGDLTAAPQPPRITDAFDGCE
ncbi:hypothetical protein OHA72_42980 [Dactylosporangium sp. NBC_01737]|uniref:hypothetical protein n=1 Tax=Dactylosporangium sp. NBC_01737 TaxID=2975959 RepID=UPI002E15DEF4|nr:hypothetical protein OHA72_42980 [Dactylosporangium sp. NBC_01737]